MKLIHAHPLKTALTGSLLAASALVACSASDATTDESLDTDGSSEVSIGQVEQALEALAPPICARELATNMSAGGGYSIHPGGTMRLEVPGSYLMYWLPPPVEAGHYEFRISARAHGVGTGYPILRLWGPGGAIGEQQVTSWPNLQTYTFEYDHLTTTSSDYVVIEYAGSQQSRDLIVEGISIACPGVTCGDTVCTGGDVCCTSLNSGALACLDTVECPFTSQGQVMQGSCDSHDDCGAGNLCVAARFGNFEFAVTCVAEENWVPISGSTIMFPICGSPGREPDPCPQGFTCGGEPSSAGLLTCLFDD